MKVDHCPPDVGHRKVSVFGIKWVNFIENL